MTPALSRRLRRLVVALLVGLVAALLLLALVLLVGAQGVTALARRVLRDQLGMPGNRLYRLSQRLADTVERLTAAIGITAERGR